jgi:hypothetical protein
MKSGTRAMTRVGMQVEAGFTLNGLKLELSLRQSGETPVPLTSAQLSLRSQVSLIVSFPFPPTTHTEEATHFRWHSVPCLARVWQQQPSGLCAVARAGYPASADLGQLRAIRACSWQWTRIVFLTNEVISGASAR